VVAFALDGEVAVDPGLDAEHPAPGGERPGGERNHERLVVWMARRRFVGGIGM
jgi:hypothetical protein